MVDVEQRALRSLEQHGLTLLECGVEQEAGVGDAMAEALGLGQQVVDHLAGVERLAVVDLDQHLVLEFQCALDLFGQQVRVEHVGDADALPGDLVLVARADTAAGGADLLAACVALHDLVDGHVIGHQQVRVGRQQQPIGVHAAVFEAAQLGQQHARVDDDAVADHVGHAGRQNARRNEVQGEVLPRRKHHRVAGVVAALVAHHPLNPSTEQVGGLTFALVAPLGADEDDCRHAAPLPLECCA
ncbi:hypothetical protein MOBUDSM44075_03956 [Mycolicibacterium obuense]|uniref:Uncharacterized protein n=1 Tax=Mycolicibacterium obuense TaxID=1807 RepID=A0A0J6VT00_9MYCO|nr:hypothetical protein MOBUDSM44075_03956 [Mycolicibacterium obuense]